MRSFHLEDPLDRQETGAIEVTVTMEDGSRRWCFFITPRLLATIGDFVEGTDVRMHPGVPHMIVVSRLDDDVMSACSTSWIARAC